MGRAIGLGVALVCALGVSGGAPISAQPPSALSPDALAALKFRYVGPVGNRVTAIEGVTGHPYIYYAGAASGGVWKTVDDGAHWEPIFDGQRCPVDWRARRRPVRSEHRLGRHRRSVHPQQHLDRQRHLQVDSTPGRRGRAWASSQTGRIAPHRRRPEERRHRVRLRARPRLRTAAGARRLQDDRRRQDVDRVHCSSTRTPAAPTSRWIRTTRACCSPGCGSSRFTPGAGRAADPAADCSSRSTAAATWKRLSGHGLPEPPLGKIVARRSRAATPNRVYALIETGDGMPTNNGQKTQSGSAVAERGRRRQLDDGERRPHACAAGRTTTRASRWRPTTTNEAYFLAAEFTKTVDGGQTSIDLTGASRAERRQPRHVDRSGQRRAGWRSRTTTA